MSEPPSVLVAVGSSPNPKLPKQSYSHIFTKYNISTIPVADAHFFNKTVQSPEVPDKTSFDIYGFLPGNAYYTHEDSIQEIVNFFYSHPNIEVVTCDMLVCNNIFTSNRYIQPQAPNDIPFFIKESCLSKINFINKQPVFQSQLEVLKQDRIIFHIASPLISLREKGSG